MTTSLQNKISNNSISPIWFIIFIVAVGWSRYLPLSHPELFNFSPVIALFFISGVFLRGHQSWVVPVLAVFISDLLLNPSYGVNLLSSFTFVSIATYLGILFLGKFMNQSQRPLPLLIGATVSALLFHGVTCGFAWLVNPVYTKSLSGFLQAQFFGEPGYAPAYLFLRNSILSTLLFTAAFSWLFLRNEKRNTTPEYQGNSSKTEQTI